MPHYGLLRKAETTNADTIVGAISERTLRSEKTLSFEFFPPKDDQAEAALWRAFDSILEVQPDFVSVTYGAGGSNKEKSITVVDRMSGLIPTIGHLTCVGASRSGTLEVLRHFEQAGVASVLALRGDPPKDNPFALANGDLKTAKELVELISSNSSLEIGVAAFPEGHPESPSLEHDAQILGLKQEFGASYAITQLFFSVEHYVDMVERSKHSAPGMPLLPGIMPISNAKQVLRMAELSGASIPQDLMDLLETDDENQARRHGMKFTEQLGRDLLASGAPGLHIFSLNQSAAALELAREVGLCS